jgi:hypothetical protein
MTEAIRCCIEERLNDDDCSWFVVFSRPKYSRLNVHPYSEITEADIQKQLWTSKGNSPPLDILVRTSGVKRLSDYMLWQV